MATVDNYKIKVEVEGKEKVDALNKSNEKLIAGLDKTQQTLSNFAKVASAAFVAVGVSALRMADRIVDVADATGIGIDKIYQLSVALEASGGNFDDAGKQLMAFSNALQGLETGNQKTIDSLNKLGISTRELETLTDEQLYSRVINGLAGMEDGFEKTAIAVDLLGKSAATLNFKTMAEGINNAADPKIAQNFKLAADAIGNMETQFRQLQIIMLDVFRPVLEQIAKFKVNADTTKEAIKILGAAIAAAFTAVTVIQIIKIVNALALLRKELLAVGAATAFIEGLTGVGLAVVAASTAAAITSYNLLGNAIDGATSEQEKFNEALKKGQAVQGKVTDASGKPVAPGAPAGNQRNVGVTALQAAKETTQQLLKQTDAALDYQRAINGTLGMLDEQATYAKINAEAERDIANKRVEYEGKINAEKAKGKNANQDIIDQLEQQLEISLQRIENDKNLNKVNQGTTFELQKQKDLLQAQTNLANHYRDVNHDILKAEQMRKVINGEITEEEMNNAIALAQIKTESAKRIADLETQFKNASSIAERQRILESIDLETERANHAIAEKKREVAAKNALEQSAAAGATKALQTITDQFTPYKVAQDQVNATWQNMSSAIDNFVNTGKFKFGDFARSIIQDLIKIELKAQATKLLSMLFKSGGPLRSILGFANGGNPPVNKPSIVGEKGPELFVPKTAGTIIPNNQLSGSAAPAGMSSAPITNNYITNNISALDSRSVAQMFAENRKMLLGTVQMAQREMP